MRVLIADDHEVVRSGFEMIVNAQDDMEVVGKVADGKEAYNQVVRLKPDVLLLDISMPPGESGLVACEKVSNDHPETKVIILTMFAEIDYLYFTLRGGAKGYVLKTSTSDELVTAIRTVYDGGTYINQEMASELTERLKDPDGIDEKNPLKVLTTREIEVMMLIAKGFTNKEIAEKIFVSVKTVEVHRSKIYSKLGIKSRAELVEIAIKYHLLEI
ncbi:MAG: response regulator transcription factor [Eggerthellaceae bacterium]|nr:response regulator transcription factor [Eggerthellaceae bacterium]